MYKLWETTYKELLLLIRDIGGLVILFLMPLVLVITVTLIQDSSFKKINDTKIPILFVDNDKDELSKSILNNLVDTKSFEIVSEIDGEPVNEIEANNLVLKGKFKLAVIIPEKLTFKLNEKISQNVENILSEFGIEQEEAQTKEQTIQPQEIKLYFDPAVQLSFKNGVKNAIDKIVAKIETQNIYKAFQEELETEEALFESNHFISFTEIYPYRKGQEIKPNSVQHNVPAWALFAIFFIVIPLSINIVKEKNQGTFVRLKTSPISFLTVLAGKILVYLCVCMLQFVLMLLVGFYLFPHLGLPSLVINGSYSLLFIVALFSGLAAIGIGVLLGTIANTSEQSAPLGATLTVILAAIGGIWVPVFIMPDFMQIIAKLSPMNWGLSAFFDVILRNGSFTDILPEIALLGSFFVLLTGITIYYDKFKNAV